MQDGVGELGGSKAVEGGESKAVERGGRIIRMPLVRPAAKQARATQRMKHDEMRLCSWVGGILDGGLSDSRLSSESNVES